jgi:hypothetical protein
MEFGAKIITKFTHAIQNWGVYLLQKCVIEVVFECFCPAKMHHPKRFLEKSIGQECPATVGFWRFHWEGASGNVEGTIFFGKYKNYSNGFYRNH